MANDNPKQYEQRGGVHLERLTRAKCAAEGLDPSKPWIAVVVTDQKTEQVAFIGEDTARKMAAGILQLLKAKAV